MAPGTNDGLALLHMLARVSEGAAQAGVNDDKQRSCNAQAEGPSTVAAEQQRCCYVRHGAGSSSDTSVATPARDLAAGDHEAHAACGSYNKGVTMQCQDFSADSATAGAKQCAHPAAFGSAHGIGQSSAGCAQDIEEDNADMPADRFHRAMLSAVMRLHGPYAFAFWHARSQRLYFAKDPLGRRSLLVHVCNEQLVLASVAPAHSPLCVSSRTEGIASGCLACDNTVQQARQSAANHRRPGDAANFVEVPPGLHVLHRSTLAADLDSSTGSGSTEGGTGSSCRVSKWSVCCLSACSAYQALQDELLQHRSQALVERAAHLKNLRLYDASQQAQQAVLRMLQDTVQMRCSAIDVGSHCQATWCESHVAIGTHCTAHLVVFFPCEVPFCLHDCSLF